MPYNPTLKYSEVVANIRKEIFERSGKEVKEFPIEELENSIVKIIGAVNPKTISRHVEWMTRLGHITEVRTGFFIIGKNYEKEVDSLLNNI